MLQEIQGCLRGSVHRAIYRLPVLLLQKSGASQKVIGLVVAFSVFLLQRFLPRFLPRWQAVRDHREDFIDVGRCHPVLVHRFRSLLWLREIQVDA